MVPLPVTEKENALLRYLMITDNATELFCFIGNCVIFGKAKGKVELILKQYIK